MGDTIKLKYDIARADFERAGDASSKTKKVLNKLGLASGRVRKVAIATYEAEMNQVIHSYGGSIEVEISAEKITITAKYQGPGIPDIDKAMQAGYSTATDRIREMGFGAGMGLPNMKRCSDRFRVESEPGKGTVVVMEINTD
jgi:serine/threonine-protein kinase RsbT